MAPYGQVDGLQREVVVPAAQHGAGRQDQTRQHPDEDGDQQPGGGQRLTALLHERRKCRGHRTAGEPGVGGDERERDGGNGVGGEQADDPPAVAPVVPAQPPEQNQPGGSAEPQHDGPPPRLGPRSEQVDQPHVQVAGRLGRGETAGDQRHRRPPHPPPRTQPGPERGDDGCGAQHAGDEQPRQRPRQVHRQQLTHGAADVEQPHPESHRLEHRGDDGEDGGGRRHERVHWDGPVHSSLCNPYRGPIPLGTPYLGRASFRLSLRSHNAQLACLKLSSRGHTM
jgi:hypothetical protein